MLIAITIVAAFVGFMAGWTAAVLFIHRISSDEARIMFAVTAAMGVGAGMLLTTRAIP